jgi:hypothetical protein
MQSILDSVGLTWSDVMPDSLDSTQRTQGKMKFNPYAVLKAIKDDVLFMALCSNTLSKSNPLEESDKEKLFEVTARLRRLYDNIK